MTAESQSTLTAPSLAESLREFLQRRHAGRARPATKDVIAQYLGTTTRVVELEIHAMRAAGEPVGSSGEGYFWCVDRADFGTTFAHIMPRFNSMRETVEGLRRAEMKLPPMQADLFGNG